MLHDNNIKKHAIIMYSPLSLRYFERRLDLFTFLPVLSPLLMAEHVVRAVFTGVRMAGLCKGDLWVEDLG